MAQGLCSYIVRITKHQVIDFGISACGQKVKRQLETQGSLNRSVGAVLFPEGQSINSRGGTPGIESSYIGTLKECFIHSRQIVA